MLSPDISPPAPPPRRWRKRVLFLLIIFVVAALLLWPRPEMASPHFMEGRYDAVTDSNVVHYHLFREGHYESHFIGNTFMGNVDGTYQSDGATVRVTYNQSPPNEASWSYRNFDGVALLLSDRSLAIYEKHGGLRPEHRQEVELWQGILVLTDPRHRASWPRLVREHPRFAAALPPKTRARFEIPGTLYLRYRWHDFLMDHPRLRDRLPTALRGN
jgi:hypothetical protein